MVEGADGIRLQKGRKRRGGCRAVAMDHQVVDGIRLQKV